MTSIQIHSSKLSWLAHGLTLLAAITCTSCVSLITPDKAPFTPNQKTSSPVGISVGDTRQNVSGSAGASGSRYYGRCRLGLYGIPTPILDPASSVAERVTKHLEAGFQQKGVEVRTIQAAKGQAVDTSPKALSAAGARKVLQLTIEDDTWIDFANPLYGAASILYFNVTARVFSPSGKLLATSTRKLQRDFHYDPNDSLFNQALLSFQPEFTNLINEPAIKSALVP